MQDLGTSVAVAGEHPAWFASLLSALLLPWPQGILPLLWEEQLLPLLMLLEMLEAFLRSQKGLKPGGINS